MRARWAASLLIGATLATLALASDRACAYIYWANTKAGTIGRAANDLSVVEPGFITGAAGPSALAVDAGHIYWANQSGNSIGRANIDGSNPVQKFINTGGPPNGVAVTPSYIFWSNQEDTEIGRADIGGGNLKKPLVDEFSPCGVATDAGHVYWTSNTTLPNTDYIARATLSGAAVQDKYSTIGGATLVCGLALSSTNIFWGNFSTEGAIGRSNIATGKGEDSALIGEIERPCGVATFADQVYWAGFGQGVIGRSDTNGLTPTRKLLTVARSDEICGIAVDGLAPPPKPPDPSNPGGGAGGGGGGGGGGPATDTKPPETTIASGPGKKLAEGKAKFTFKSNEPGSRFECKLDGKKYAACRSPKSYSGLKPGRHTFRARAIDAAGNSDATPAKRSFRVPS